MTPSPRRPKREHSRGQSGVVMLLAALLGLAALLTACGEQTAQESEPTGGESTLSVVATTGMVADTVRAVAGEHAEVSALIRPGVDPHLFKPTRPDIAAILHADAVFSNGLLLEGRMTETLDRAAESGKPVQPLAASIAEDTLIHPESGAAHADPHVWMDPRLWAQTVPVVRDRLIEIDPEHEAGYTANAEAFAAELAELDAYAERVLASVPESQRVLVTAHDAFNYFGRRYGYDVVGIQGISTESEAGVRDIERLVSLLVDRRIGAVFVESTVSERNIRALIDGAAARGHTVTIGGELFSDAMGPEGSYRGTYPGMIDHNVTTIARALGGDAPEAGRLGKLTD